MVAHTPFLIRSVHGVPNRLVLSLLVAATTALGFGACNKAPLLAPSGTVITLISTANTVPLNGAADIVALVIENGTATAAPGPGATTAVGAGTPVHNGTTVSFTTTLGRIEPAEGLTTDGKVTVKLMTGDLSGVAIINAFSGGSKATALSVNVGGVSVTRVVMSASPQSLPFGGGTSTINARVEDKEGNGVPGFTVNFLTDVGSVSPASATADSSGVARTTLSTTHAGTTTVTATAGAQSSTTKVVVGASTVTLGVPTTPAVSTPASFTVTPSTGASLANVIVDFGDGSTQSLGAISSVTTVVHLYAAAGTFTVTATAVDSDGARTSVATAIVVAALSATGTSTTVAASVPASLTITLSPTTASIDHYEWTFGDGQTAETTGAVISHVYAVAGIYNVTVRVVPLKGAAITVTIQVRIT